MAEISYNSDNNDILHFVRWVHVSDEVPSVGLVQLVGQSDNINELGQ